MCSTVGDRTYPDMTGADLRRLACITGAVPFAPPSRLSRPPYSSRSTRTVVTRKNRNSFFTRRNAFRRMPRFTPSDNAARRRAPPVLWPYSSLRRSRPGFGGRFAGKKSPPAGAGDRRTFCRENGHRRPASVTTDAYPTLMPVSTFVGPGTRPSRSRTGFGDSFAGKK